ncbi:M56 family metallopeptidase [Pontibacter sp. MBLB2868]|uniref:M56 family metallopeptidase n=1 Tax=Pontibacter sp. MBLB2868 TaxID=3451555 RepID=UPI003F74E5C2
MSQVLDNFSETLVKAMGWTLLHSLWQGALLALVLSLLMLLLHRHTSKTRYLVTGSALLLQVLLSALTFDHYYSAAYGRALPVTEGLAINSSAQAVVLSPSATSFWMEILAKAQLYFEQNLPLLVTIWLMGLVLMTLRFIGGLAYTQRLRHYKTNPLAEKWQQKLSMLRQELGMSRAVRLVESGLVQVPMAIGYAKPVILIPIGAVTGLSQVQVEAILAHELAHIQRRDYLFNLMQSVIDIIYFYHPAMWWISGLVRAERENCCDDIAVAVCGDQLTYARALAELEAMRLPAGPALSMAFSGKRGTLLSRIKRLVGQQTLRPTFTEGFAAALVLVAGLSVVSCGAMASLQSTDKTPESKTTALYQNESKQADALTEEDTNAFAFAAQGLDGQKRDVVIIKNKKGKVTDLYVDGKRIPKKDIPSYSNLIDQRLQAIEKAPKATAAEVAMEMEIAQNAVADAQRRQQENFNYVFRFQEGDSAGFAPVPPMPPMPPMAPMPPNFVMPPMPPLPPPPAALFPGNEEDQKQHEKAMKQYEKELKKHEAKLREYELQIEKQQGAGRVDKQRIERQVHRQMELAEIQAERSKVMALQHEEMAKRHKEMAKKHEEQMQKLKKEMVKDGLLKNETDKIEIRMTKDSFYVNGKKQSQEMFEKYKKLMEVKIEGDGSFNFQYNSK